MKKSVIVFAIIVLGMSCIKQINSNYNVPQFIYIGSSVPTSSAGRTDTIAVGDTIFMTFTVPSSVIFNNANSSTVIDANSFARTYIASTFFDSTQQAVFDSGIAFIAKQGIVVEIPNGSSGVASSLRFANTGTSLTGTFALAPTKSGLYIIDNSYLDSISVNAGALRGYVVWDFGSGTGDAYYNNRNWTVVENVLGTTKAIAIRNSYLASNIDWFAFYVKTKPS